MNQTGRANPHQRRLIGFGLNMIVMALSFMLYYLGLFGTVDGPLSMTNISKAISSSGITVNDVRIILVILFVIALTWNWIINIVARRAGWNFSCTAGKKEKQPCGQLVQRSREAKGQGWVYTCPSGHRGTEALFHPIRKGKVATSLLMVALAACAMFYVS
ncbi:MAG: hypothetical protein AB9866_27195 [Syntrophobacteraceae bacterium]